MAKSGITFKGFRQFEKALSARGFGEVLQKHVGLATGRNARLVQRAIRQKIKHGVKPPNAPLTVAIKQSDKPLVDRGDLFGAISVVQPDWRSAFIGVNRKDPLHDIAEVLHEGKIVPVTQKMRGLFFMLWLASKAARGDADAPMVVPLSGRARELFERFQDWRPLKPETRAIKIPARPFIRQAFEDPQVRRRVMEGWVRAVGRAAKEVTRGR